jgi:hypothetical protein
MRICGYNIAVMIGLWAVFSFPAEAETLRGTIRLSTASAAPARVSLDVSQGRIRSVTIRLPASQLPTPWSFDNWFPPTYVHEGVSGHKYAIEIDPQLVADSELHYTNITTRSAREIQKESKVFRRTGTQEIFVPDGGTTQTVISEDRTPYMLANRGRRVIQVATTHRESTSGEKKKGLGDVVLSFQGHTARSFDNLAVITLASTTLTLKEIGRGRWRLTLAISRDVSETDVLSTWVYRGAGNLRGRAAIDLDKVAP